MRHGVPARRRRPAERVARARIRRVVRRRTRRGALVAHNPACAQGDRYVHYESSFAHPRRPGADPLCAIQRQLRRSIRSRDCSSARQKHPRRKSHSQALPARTRTSSAMRALFRLPNELSPTALTDDACGWCSNQTGASRVIRRNGLGSTHSRRLFCMLGATEPSEKRSVPSRCCSASFKPKALPPRPILA